MPLSTGQRLGVYEVVGRLGAGAMGEVYRARDGRLGREVALKVLPAEFAADPDRRRRFELESRAASALNHPNIVAVYDAGEEQGVAYIVSELVDGESLRDIIQRGAMPVRRVAEIGAQLADGLAAAHAAGVVHRDMKPENVMLTRDGRPKILDFGLARYQAAVATAEGTATMTQAGVIMGTIAYMSPEQVTGAPADARSDIFSLGIILHEMLSGRPPFSAATSVETMTAILRSDPPDLPETIPPQLRQIVAHCLEKEPVRRFESARDLAFGLRGFAGGFSSSLGVAAIPAAAPRKRLLPLVTAALALLLLLAIAALLRRAPGADLAAYRFTPFATESEMQDRAVWSPDGKNVAYLRIVMQGPNTIMVRAADSLVPSAVAKVTGLRALFWSPDASQLYYVSGDGVSSVSRAGGPSQQVLKGPYEAAAISPDGKAMVLWLGADGSNESKPKILVSSPPGAPPRAYDPVLFKMNGTFSPVYLGFSPDGRQVLLSTFREAGPQIWVLPFPDGAGAHGKPRRILASRLSGANVPTYSWMPDSRHVVAAIAELPGSRLWMADTVDETLEPVTADEGRKSNPTVSPDGNRLLFTAEYANFDLVELPLGGGDTVRPLLATNRDEVYPAWSPTGTQYAYVSNRDGPQEIWLKSIQEGWERPLVTQRDFPDDENHAFLNPSFSPDGSRIAYGRVSSKRFGAIWISPVGGGTPIRLTSANDVEMAPAWSPDGNWIAYFSSDAGLMKARVGASEAPVKLLDRGCANQPQWSPDSQSIACALDEGITLLTAEGKNLRTFPNHGGYVTWSRDGKEIYALTENSGRWTLGAIDVKTGNQRKISDYGARYNFASPFSPSFPLSLSHDGTSLATSVINIKSEIWMLEGYRRPSGLLGRLWPFGR